MKINIFEGKITNFMFRGLHIEFVLIDDCLHKSLQLRCLLHHGQIDLENPSICHWLMIESRIFLLSLLEERQSNCGGVFLNHQTECASALFHLFYSLSVPLYNLILLCLACENFNQISERDRVYKTQSQFFYFSIFFLLGFIINIDGWVLTMYVT